MKSITKALTIGGGTALLAGLLGTGVAFAGTGTGTTTTTNGPAVSTQSTTGVDTPAEAATSEGGEAKAGPATADPPGGPDVQSGANLQSGADLQQ